MQPHQMELLAGDIAEAEKLRILCQHHNVQPVDSSVFQRLHQDVAWEIFDFNLKTIYRSELISKSANYSDEEYRTASPWDLFKRPQAIVVLLAEKTMDLKIAKKILNLDNVPAYVIEETKTVERAQYRMRHLFACPLASKTSKENLMFLSAFQIEDFKA